MRKIKEVPGSEGVNGGGNRQLNMAELGRGTPDGSKPTCKPDILMPFKGRKKTKQKDPIPNGKEVCT